MPSRVPLSNGLVAVVDDEDFDIVTASGPWYAGLADNGRYYAKRGVRVGARTTTEYLHQVLLPGVSLIDHRNGDSLDNRRANLRSATPQENARNATRRASSAAPYKGVTFHPGRGWRARIFDGKRVHLGYFDTAEGAANAYDAAARARFGEFAWLNFPADAPDVDPAEPRGCCGRGC